MQRNDELQRLLSDLDDHDDDEGLDGSVWSEVVTAMERAWEQLHDYEAEVRGAEALRRAGDEMQRAITLLAAVQGRVERLAQTARTRDPSPALLRWAARGDPARAASRTRYR